jgi:hypothetical protein
MKNERQDCEIQYGGTCVRRRLNGGDEGEGIQSMNFIHIQEIEK